MRGDWRRVVASSSSSSSSVAVAGLRLASILYVVKPYVGLVSHVIAVVVRIVARTLDRSLSARRCIVLTLRHIVLSITMSTSV